MSPRIRLRPQTFCTTPPPSHLTTSHLTTSYHGTIQLARYAAVVPSVIPSSTPIVPYPPSQPPSHKPPHVRKTQLHRQYQSLLRSSPLLLVFQHNNVKAVELMGIRRELAAALRKLDAQREQEGQEGYGKDIKLQMVQTGIFASALRVVEFYKPQAANTQGQAISPPTHGLSRHAYNVSNKKRLESSAMRSLLSGPIALLSLPAVTPAYLKIVLSILSPHKPDFSAPTRKANPDYYEPSVQTGLQKLMLLGARVEGRVFDIEGTRWVGGIEGGVDGLRAQLVQLLQGAGTGLAGALEGVGKSLYVTVEGRRMDLESQQSSVEEK